jgi:hypothetical protein
MRREQLTKRGAALHNSIVLVPGLGGHYIGTWKADDQTVWPRDLLPLPDNIPDLRILSFQYNTSLNGTTSQGGIRDHANDLLVWLFNDREDDEMASLRPVVFVGHSLGGIVIKSVRNQSISVFNHSVHVHTSSADTLLHTKALTKMARNRKYQNLWDATRGVMFFATPHFGLDKEKWRQFAHRVLLHRAPSESVLPTANMLEELRVNSSMLERVTEDFQPLQPELSFVTFIENTPMEGMDEVVRFCISGIHSSVTDFPLTPIRWSTACTGSPVPPTSFLANYPEITLGFASSEMMTWTSLTSFRTGSGP